MKQKTDNNHNGIISLIPHTFNIKDVLQVMIGASILAIPVGFTEETWRLGQELPLHNVIGFGILSLVFISTFVYYNYHHKNMTLQRRSELPKRIFSTYILSFIVVAILMTLIQKAPWTTDLLLAIKRTILVTFPASMSAAVADTIK